MKITNELFTIIESTPLIFGKSKQTIFRYALTLIVQKEEETGSNPSLLFLTSPGFRLTLPASENMETIVQLVFSDFLSDFFHHQPLAFIGGFLRRSSGCRLLLPGSLMQDVEDSFAGLRNNSGFESFEKFFQLMNRLATAGEAIVSREHPFMPSGAQVADKINKVANYVREHFRRPLRIKEVADITGFSEAHFSRFFKRYTGSRFNDYVNVIRIEEATLLLLKTDDTISGIAYSCGFNTPHYFSAVFKRYKGKRPGELRIMNYEL